MMGTLGELILDRDLAADPEPLVVLINDAVKYANGMEIIDAEPDEPAFTLQARPQPRGDRYGIVGDGEIWIQITALGLPLDSDLVWHVCMVRLRKMHDRTRVKVEGTLQYSLKGDDTLGDLAQKCDPIAQKLWEFVKGLCYELIAWADGNSLADEWKNDLRQHLDNGITDDNENEKIDDEPPDARLALTPSSGNVKLIKPPKDAPLGEHFNYYHECKRARIKYTLKDLAEYVCRNHAYIRQEHAKYQEERDEQNS